MSRTGEIDYLKKIGPEGVRHAINKPFSDDDCGSYLVRMGAVMLLLPAPPARLLDLGCGVGWTSAFFARRGYTVSGIDLAPDAIEQAAATWKDVRGLDFQVANFEDTGGSAEFDCAVFFDSLHHAADEEAALAYAWRRLKPGGVCVTSEPGAGHATTPASIAAREKYDVTEKELPPELIVRLAREVGFRKTRVFPSAERVAALVYSRNGVRSPGWFNVVENVLPQAIAGLLHWLRLYQRKSRHGVCLLTK